MPRKKKDGKFRVFSVAMPHLHLALLDFIVHKIGKVDINRSVIVRRALEEHVLKHDCWDYEDFEAFAKKYGEETVPVAADRRRFMDDVGRFARRSAFRSDSETLGDIIDLEVATSRAIFDL